MPLVSIAGGTEELLVDSFDAILALIEPPLRSEFQEFHPDTTASPDVPAVAFVRSAGKERTSDRSRRSNYSSNKRFDLG